MRSSLFFPILFFNFLASCGSMEMKKVDGFGLPVAQIAMDTENLGLLLGQLQSKRPTVGELRIDGQLSLHCDISFAGQSSLEDFRKSYNFRRCTGSRDQRTRFRLAAQNRDQATVRSVVAYELYQAMNLPVPSAELVAAYRNADYLGVYLLAEPISIEFYERRGIKVQHLYQAKFGNSGFGKEFASNIEGAFDYEGDYKDNFVTISGLYSTLWSAPDNEEFSRRLRSQIDIDNFLSYMATSVFLCHWDGFDNNFFIALDESKKRLFLTPWDLDRVWESVDQYQPQDLIVRNEILTRMLSIPEFKSEFIAKLDMLLSEYPVEKLLQRVDAYHINVQEALRNDSINGPNQQRHLQELNDKVRNWHAKVVLYRNAQ